MLDDRGLVLADVEVGVRGPGQRVGRGGDEAGTLGRHRLELGDDAPDGGGVAAGGLGARECGLGSCRLPRSCRGRRCGGTWVLSVVGLEHRAARGGPRAGGRRHDTLFWMRTRFVDVRLIDGVADHVREHVDVEVDGERIAAVVAHDSRRPEAPDEHVIEGAGRTLLPGLIDAHAHYTFDPTRGLDRHDRPTLGRRDRPRRGGTRGPRPAGRRHHRPRRRVDPEPGGRVLRDAIAAGRIPGPRLVVAGTAVGITGGHGHQFGLEADGPDALRDRDAPGRSRRRGRGQGRGIVRAWKSGGHARAARPATRPRPENGVQGVGRVVTPLSFRVRARARERRWLARPSGGRLVTCAGRGIYIAGGETTDAGCRSRELRSPRRRAPRRVAVISAGAWALASRPLREMGTCSCLPFHRLVRSSPAPSTFRQMRSAST